MTTVNKDIDNLSPESSDIITLESGFTVRVERLKTRQLMSLMKILTRGLGGAVATIFTAQQDEDGSEEYAAQLLGAMLMSIPEAEDETIEFVKRMVSPGALNPDARTKPELGANEELWVKLDAHLDNPEIIDLITICTRIVEVEAPHIQALGKNLAVLFKVKNQSDTAKAGSKKSSASSKASSAS